MADGKEMTDLELGTAILQFAGAQSFNVGISGEADPYAVVPPTAPAKEETPAPTKPNYVVSAEVRKLIGGDTADDDYQLSPESLSAVQNRVVEKIGRLLREAEQYRAEQRSAAKRTKKGRNR